MNSPDEPSKRGLALFVLIGLLMIGGMLYAINALTQQAYKYEAVKVKIPPRVPQNVAPSQSIYLPPRRPIIPDRELWATWYGATLEECIGCAPYYDAQGLYFLMANGDRFDEFALTAAANWLPLGSIVELTWGDQVIAVTITDRMLSDEKIDLSKIAFSKLTGDLSIGSAFIRAKVIYLP